MALADPRLWEFRSQLLKRLAVPSPDTVALAKTVASFVDEAGKEASARRARARQVIRFVIEFYRHVLRVECGVPPPDDAELQTAVGAAVAAGRLDRLSATAVMDRSLEALSHVDRNANQGALVECWLDDLARIALRSAGEPTRLAAG